MRASTGIHVCVVGRAGTGKSEEKKLKFLPELKGLSSEMEGGIKVVLIKRPLFKSNLRRCMKRFFIIGSPHKLLLKVSALYQVYHFKKHTRFKLRCLEQENLLHNYPDLFC